MAVSEKKKDILYDHFLRKLFEIAEVAPNMFFQSDSNCFERYFDTDEFYYGEQVANSIGISIFYGASKLVFVDEDIDYVAKIPFCGLRDYCDLEVGNYNEISFRYPTYSHYFAECWRAGTITIEGVELPLYIMEKAEVDEFKVYEMSDNYRIENGGSDTSDLVLDCLAFTYGNEVYDIMNIIDEMHINDLHSGNVGFKNDMPVFIDYSGYYA